MGLIPLSFSGRGTARAEGDGRLTVISSHGLAAPDVQRVVVTESVRTVPGS
jgi:hypothetical protein